MTTLDDGNYELVLEQDQGFSEDPNQSSEVSDTPTPNPTQEGKPRCIPQYFNLLPFHLYIIYLALRLGVEMKPQMHNS
jgi:hypothetical protein